MSYKKEFQAAKYFYFKVWRGNEKPSPAFNGEIVRVTRAGWNHTIFSPRRDNKQIIFRLKLLPYAKKILEKQSKIKYYRKVDKTQYWAIESVEDGVLIRVIVRSVNSNNKHFFSVFAKGVIKKPLLRLLA